MTKTVEDLLAKATTILEQGENEALGEAIEKLKALGDEAKGSTQEYKDLKAMVDEIDAQNGGDTGGDTGGTEQVEVVFAFSVYDDDGEFVPAGTPVKLKNGAELIKSGKAKKAKKA